MARRSGHYGGNRRNDDGRRHGGRKGYYGWPPGATIEQRVKRLEQTTAHIQTQDLPEIRKEQRDGEQRVTTQLQDAETRLSTRMTKAEATAKAASASDLALEWLGVIFLL